MIAEVICTFDQTQVNCFLMADHRKAKLLVTSSAPNPKRAVEQSFRGKSGDENQVRSFFSFNPENVNVWHVRSNRIITWYCLCDKILFHLVDIRDMPYKALVVMISNTKYYMVKLMVFHFSNFRMALLLQDVSAMKLWSLACYIVRHWVINYDQPVPLVFMNQLILQYMPLSCSRSVLQATIQVKGWLGVKMYWATPIRSL